MEYEIAYLEGSPDTERQKGFLGGWLSEGWELITVIPNIDGWVYGEGRETSGGTEVVGLWFYFKRPKTAMDNFTPRDDVLVGGIND